MPVVCPLCSYALSWSRSREQRVLQLSRIGLVGGLGSTLHHWLRSVRPNPSWCASLFQPAGPAYTVHACAIAHSIVQHGRGSCVTGAGPLARGEAAQRHAERRDDKTTNGHQSSHAADGLLRATMGETARWRTRDRNHAQRVASRQWGLWLLLPPASLSQYNAVLLQA